MCLLRYCSRMEKAIDGVVDLLGFVDRWWRRRKIAKI